MKLLRSLALAFLLAQPAAADLQIGVARVEIPCPPGTPLAGYGARFGRTSRGVHDPVHARALALESGGRRLVVVSADLVAIPGALRLAVLERVPLEPAELLLAATHNHSGPGGVSDHPLAIVAGGLPSVAQTERIVAALAGAARQALTDLRPGSLGIASIDLAGFSENRRVAGGPVDPTAGVVRALGADGRLRAVWVHFTAHPTILGADNRLASAGWPGALSAALEADHPGAVALFTNGAAGDQRPAGVVGIDPFARATDFGRRLADRVAAALPAIEVADGLFIASEVRSVEMPPSAFGSLAPTTTIVQRIELGDTVWMALPGEPVVEIGLELRRRATAAGARAAFVVGTAGDHLAYFTTREGYCRSGTESRTSLYGPGAADLLVEALVGGEGDDPDGPPAWRRDVDGIDLAMVAGDARAMGRAQGRLYAEEIRALAAAVRRLVVARAREALTGDLDPRTIALLPLLDDLAPAVVAQPLRRGLAAAPADLVLEMEGVAEGAGVPFDLVVLLNRLPALVSDAMAPALFDVGALLDGGAAGPTTDGPAGGGRVVARSVDGRSVLGSVVDLAWSPVAYVPRVLVRRPTSGRATIGIGWPGQVGLDAGMNDAGQVAAWVGAAGPADLDGQPVSLAVRAALEQGTAARGPFDRPAEIVGPGRAGAATDLDAARAAVRATAGDESIELALFDPAVGAVDVWRRRGGLGWVRLDATDLFAGRIPDGAGPARRYGDPAGFVYHHTPFESTTEVLRRTGLLPGETRVEFDSPFTSGVAENDRCYGFLYETSRATDRAIVLMPIWKGRDLTIEQSLARILAAMGYRVLVLPLAYQFERAPARRSGDWTVSSDLARNHDSFLQSVLDAQRAARWLVDNRPVDRDRVAVMGVSMGGHVAALAYGATTTFSAGIFLLAGGQVADTLWNDADETRRIKRDLKAEGVTLADLRALSRDFDPLTYARPDRASGVYMAAGRFDELVYPRNVEALADAYGGVDVRWLPSGHYSAWVGLPTVLVEIDGHLDHLWGSGR